MSVMDTNGSDNETVSEPGQSNPALVLVRVNQLEARIGQLETRRRSLMQFVILAFIVWTGALVAIEYSIMKNISRRFDTKTLVTEELFIESKYDDSGIGLLISDKNEPAIVFTDKKRRNRMTIGLAGNGVPVIDFYDEKFRRRLNLGSQSGDGSGAVVASFGGMNSPRRLELGLTPRDLPFIHFNDDTGQNRVTIELMEDGKAILQLVNPDGIRSIQLLSMPGSEPSSLKIIGKDDVYTISK
jgi:hypothetical protein